MDHDVIRFHGSYRFADRPALELALARVRAELDDDDDNFYEPSRWRRAFITHGARLDVSLAVALEYRFAAANVLLALAHAAIDGSVEVKLADRAIDLYAAGFED